MKKVLSIILVILMIMTSVPFAFAAGDGVPLVINVEDETNAFLGDTCEYEQKKYDEDGYVLIGNKLNSCANIFDSCSITLDNLTTGAIDDCLKEGTVNVTLKGTNEVTRFSMFDANFVFDAEDGASLKTRTFNTSGNDGTVTVNSGNIKLEYETDVNIPTVSCADFTVNGGSVTVSNNYFYAIDCKTTLNGGVLNVISTSETNEAINDTITIAEGALLTVAAEYGILRSNAEILKAEEDDYFFVRYDTESDFVIVKDIKEALAGKKYAEIKVGSHEHAYNENGVCICGELTEAIWKSEGEFKGVGTLSDAFQAAADGTVDYITLNKDITVNESFWTEGGTYTLDINGKKLSLEGGDDIWEGVVTLSMDTTLTIDDTAEDKGIIKSNQSGVKVSNGTLNLKNVVIEAMQYGVVSSTGQALTINGAAIHGEELAGIITGGITTVADGKITGKSGVLLNVASSELIMSGGELDGVESDIKYMFGTVDLSEYDDINGLRFYCDNDEKKPVSDILIPDGYFFFDNEGKKADIFRHRTLYTVSNHEHSYSDDGMCECGKSCEHPDFDDSICTVCGYTCEHSSFVDGICEACGKACEHKSHCDGACVICGADVEDTFILLGEYMEISISDAHEYVYVYFTPEVSRNYRIYSEGDADPYIYIYDSEGNKIAYLDDADENGYNFDGEFDAEEGETYLFKLSRYGGVQSYTFRVIPCVEFAHQPDFDEPYVELYGGEIDGYQWYEKEKIKAQITDENADTVSYEWGKSSYDSEKGWSGVPYNEMDPGYDFFTVSLKKGDRVTVELSGDFSGYAGLCDYSKGNDIYEYITKGVNTYTFTAERDGDYTFYTCYGGDGDPVTVKATLYTGADAAAVEGETQAEFIGELDKNKIYMCKVILKGGIEIYSDEFSFIYKITHQPTEDEPYVAVNDGEGTSYQWYEAAEGTVEINDDNAVGRYGAEDGEYAEYDAEKGWIGSLDYIGDDYVELNYFIMKLKKGDKVTVQADKEIEEIVMWASEGYYDDSKYPEGTEAVEFVAPYDGEYSVRVNAYYEDTYIRAYKTGTILNAIDGETSAAIGNTEYGKQYVCNISFPDGTAEESKILDLRYKITHQPTEDEPYVAVNNGEGASYQWSEIITSQQEVNSDNERVSGDWSVLGAPEHIKGYYTEERGWESDTGYYFVANLREGETVTGEASAEFPEARIIYLEDGELNEFSADVDGNKFSFTVEKDGWYGLCIPSVIIVESEEESDSKGITVRAWIDGIDYEAIDGETSATIGNTEYGKQYVCDVTFVDGTTEKSKILDFRYKITHQPTAGEPYVTLNNSEDAAYQWYEMVGKPEEVNKENAYPYNVNSEKMKSADMDGLFEEIEYESSFNDGWWSPICSTYEEYVDEKYFIISLEKGDVLEIEAERNDNGNAIYLREVDGNSSLYIDLDENNKCSYTATKDGTFIVSGEEKPTENPAKIRATVTKFASEPIEGETDAALLVPVLGKRYFCQAVAKDGTVLSSDSFTYIYAVSSLDSDGEKITVGVNEGEAEYQWYSVDGEKEYFTDENAEALDLTPEEAGPMFIDFDSSYDEQEGWSPAYMNTGLSGLLMVYFAAELESGDVLNVELSDDVDIFGLIDIVRKETIFADVVDGKATVTVEKSGMYYIVASGADIVTLKAYTDNRTFTPIEGETSPTFTPTEEGKYACEVTFEDGSTEMTDEIVYDHVHSGGTQTCMGYLCECGTWYGEADAQAHSGGTASCTDKAVCEYCGVAYGDVDPDNHSDNNGDYICDNGCGYEYEKPTEPTTKPTTTKPVTEKEEPTTKPATTNKEEPTTKAPATTLAPTTKAPETTKAPATTEKEKPVVKVKKPAKVKIKKSVSKKKKQIIVTWAKVKAANGYQVAYSTGKKFTKKTTKTKLIKKAKTVKTTIKKLRSGKKYFIKVRAYKNVGGKKLYGAYSKVKTVKVK